MRKLAVKKRRQLLITVVSTANTIISVMKKKSSGNDSDSITTGFGRQEVTYIFLDSHSFIRQKHDKLYYTRHEESSVEM